MLYLGLQLRITHTALRPRGHDDVLTLLSLAQVVPKLLGEEGHVRMQQLQHILEQTDGGLEGNRIDRLRHAINERRLDALQGPAAQVVPHEFVGGHQRLADPELVV